TEVMAAGSIPPRRRPLAAPQGKIMWLFGHSIRLLRREGLKVFAPALNREDGRCLPESVPAASD
ncbi:MAG: hypothetical protein K6T17_09140, partial [Fimbriimonadales bacterium]|nr:hypothetical protein [Fimbriimonadales bacterium]